MARLSDKSFEPFVDESPGEIVDRFNATLRAEGAAIRRELRQEFDTKLSELRIEMLKREGNLLKFLFFFYWSGSLIALGALIVWAFGPR